MIETTLIFDAEHIVITEGQIEDKEAFIKDLQNLLAKYTCKDVFDHVEIKPGTFKIFEREVKDHE